MFSLLIFCSLCFIAFSKVLELDKDNWHELEEKDFAITMFYAPWCGHCKNFKPIYEDVSKDFDGILTRIDCDANSDMCKKYDVTGYPTIKVFRKGEEDKDAEQVPREKGKLREYILQATTPDFVEIEKKEDIILPSKYQVIGYCESDKDRENFKKLCKTIRNYMACGIADKALAKEMGTEPGKLVLYQGKNFHNKFFPNHFESDIKDAKKMRDFIDSKYPSFGDIRTQSNTKKFKEPLCTAYYYMDYEHNPKQSNFWRNRILRALHDNKIDPADLSVSVASIIEFAHEVDGFGFEAPTSSEVTPENLKLKPKVACLKDGKKYPMEKEFTEKDFGDFIKQFLAGKLSPHVKSEPIPTEDDGHVKVVVGKTFDDIVMDEDKDVLIEFYAPWCGHCKSLAPKYKQVAEKLKDDKDHVVLAKLDATANDFPSIFEVKGYPTLYWVPKGKKSKPVPFNAGREAKDIIEFIAKHSTKELTNYDRKGKAKKGKDAATAKDKSEDDKTEL